MKRLRYALVGIAAAVMLSACSDGLEPEPIDFLDAQHDVTVEPDIVYGSGEVRLPAPGDKDLLLDLYRPTDAGAPPARPAVVLIHGGGFSSGSRLASPVAELGRRFAELGYVAVSISYRLTGDDPPTEALATDPGDPLRRAAAAARVDAALAVQWLRDHAADYDVDTDRIAVAGYSAGAITAIGVAYWEPGVQRADVRAVFSLSGGLPGSETMIEAGEPPLLLIHGDVDTARAAQEAVATRAAAVGLTYEVYQLPGVNHAQARESLDTTLGSTTVWGTIAGFFYEHLELASLS